MSQAFGFGFRVALNTAAVCCGIWLATYLNRPAEVHLGFDEEDSYSYDLTGRSRHLPSDGELRVVKVNDKKTGKTYALAFHKSSWAPTSMVKLDEWNEDPPPSGREMGNGSTVAVLCGNCGRPPAGWHEDSRGSKVRCYCGVTGPYSSGGSAVFAWNEMWSAIEGNQSSEVAR